MEARLTSRELGFGGLASGPSTGLSRSTRAATTPLPSESLATKRTLQSGARLITLLAAALLAQSSLRAQENTGTVCGFIHDSSTGAPLAQVHIEMSGDATMTATTGTAGSFVFEHVPVGLYTVSYTSASHQAVNVNGLEVLSGEIADASAAMSTKLESTLAFSQVLQEPAVAERKAAATESDTITAKEIRNATLSAESEATEPDDGATTPDDYVFVRTVGRRAKRAVGLNRNGVRIQTSEGAFTSEMHLRSQIRFSSPFAGAPRKPEHFTRANDRDLRFRRARFKSSGQVFRPWIRYATEYDLVNTRMLDLRVTIQKWEWLQFRFGQWKTEFGRERVSSSGRQEFVERSIVNRHFTADRQKGFMVLGRLNSGTWADSRYYAGVFSGNGRGFRSSGAGSLDNRDGVPMWTARYQWNFLKEDPGFSQSDTEYHEKPVAAIAVSALSNRSRFTRFSGSGGGTLDGFEVGRPGQFAIKQAAEDFVLKYRGLFLQHEFHWKTIRDRIYHRITSLRGAYVQGGYFPHRVARWVPKQLELGLRYGVVDQDRARQSDMITETAFVLNWFMEGHGNKLTFDVTRYRLGHASGMDLSRMQARLQWDVTF